MTGAFYTCCCTYCHKREDAAGCRNKTSAKDGSRAKGCSRRVLGGHVTTVPNTPRASLGDRKLRIPITPSTVRTGNTLRIRFSATLGEEPEVEVAVV
jgi:hypothetical protein